ncbi:nitrate reductase subunit beta [Escherichia coli]
MKIRSQVGMVLNLDKCIGCHTCSVTCKNVWTGREGMEYAWFNNVETKPGIGYPKNWEDQEEWQGGWVRDVNGKIRPRLGSKMGVITKIFANPVVPQIDDYYEPFTFDYEHLHSAPEGKHIPTARPRSLIDGKRMDKVIWGPNWEELLGGEFEKRARDRNFEAMQKEMYGQFENTFMMYLPRLCEHCLNPSFFCYPRIESGQPTVCSETCVGRIRYLGVLLYDADRIEEAASTEREVDLYERQCEVFLDPHDPSVIEEALKQGIPQNVIEAAQRSPVYKMAMDWKLALPLHPEYRTLPMVWYVPPLSPIQSYADAGGLPKSEGVLPAIESLRIPVQYLANMLSAGDTGPVLRALKRMMAMRHYMRSQTVEGVTDTRAIDEVGLSVAQVEEMYRYLAIANYEDRFVIPTSHWEMAGDAFAERNGCGFTFGDGCHGSDSKFNLFNSSRIDAINITEVRDKAEGE